MLRLTLLASVFVSGSALAATSFPEAANPANSVGSTVLMCLNSAGQAVPLTSGQCSGAMPGQAGSSYTLSTTPTQNVVAGSYIFTCVSASWAGGSIKLQAIGPDNATYLDVGTALTANGTLGVVLGANAKVRLSITGSPVSPACNLS